MPSSPLKLLLVDDDPALLTVLEQGLSLDGDYAVTAVLNAEEALAHLMRGSFDLLVSDFSLNHPEINGLKLLEAARELPSPPLVIIITAYASLQVTLQSITLGAYDFLTKPFQIEELQLVVRNAGTLMKTRHENNVLREHVQRLGQMLEAMDRDQHEMLERLRQMERIGEGSDTGPLGSTAGLAAPDPGALQELRRRRMREQLGQYVRLSETFAEQLSRERERIESLVEIGLIPEGTYQRAIRDGRLNPSEG